jgi:hypothetical protein
MKKKATKKVYNLVIVDESGSMSVIQRETIAGINETISTCQEMQKVHPEMEQYITLISFDSRHFKTHYDNVRADKARMLDKDQYNPSAATPLYDAIGMGVAIMNAHTGVKDKVLVTIITDGYENSSHEYSLKMVKNLIDKQKKQGWTFTLIGTDNLDVAGMARSMSIDNHLEFSEDAEATEAMFERERACRKRFGDYCYADLPMEEGFYFD